MSVHSLVAMGAIEYAAQIGGVGRRLSDGLGIGINMPRHLVRLEDACLTDGGMHESEIAIEACLIQDSRLSAPCGILLRLSFEACI